MIIRYFTYYQFPEGVSMQMYREILYYPMHVHFGGFLVGMIVYEIYYQFRDKDTKKIHLSNHLYFSLLTLALASIVFQHAIYYSDVPAYYCIYRTSLLEATIGIIMVLSLSNNSPVDRFLSNPFFTPLSRISYGMYLWNIVFCAAIWKSAFGGSYTQKQTWLVALFGYFLVNGALFIWAAILFRYTEYPFLKIKDRNKDKVSLMD
jgi:peptidoglycan/LPS O-acetylase OafA/YrhL